ncbi:MAG: hypothetical protein IH878_14570 [Gemmatimonadetes bacterium]|nr:hypothetical protein [Gemmatimonadota bacterium]
MTTRRFISFFGAVAFSALFRAGCRAEEQGRITQYQPGIYLGKKDTKLSTEQVKQLRLRSAMQSSAVYRSGGGGSRKADVRRPASGTRTNLQGNP